METQTEVVTPGGDGEDAPRPSQPLPHLADVEQTGDVREVEASEQDRAVAKARDGEQLAEDEYAAAIEFMLADEVDVEIKKLDVRVGGSEKDPVTIPWLVRAVDVNVIRQAEREASGSQRQQRRGQSYDEVRANVRIIVEGTMKPDLKALAGQQGLRDAALLVERQFARRPGVIPQIAGQIMDLSGFNIDDVVAAGN